jgi:hypothetical protein
LISARTSSNNVTFSLIRTLAAETKQTKGKGAAGGSTPPPPLSAAAGGGAKKGQQSGAAAVAVEKPKEQVKQQPKIPKAPKEPKPPRELLPWGEKETIRLLRLAETFGKTISVFSSFPLLNSWTYLLFLFCHLRAICDHT